MTDTRSRVKLYTLNVERQWDDRGTGHVSSTYVERLKGISLLVRAESDGSLLLESKIQPYTAYQKQQDTLIIWSEGNNLDLALSFQEKGGCDEIWEKICSVQGKEFTQDGEDSENEGCFDEIMIGSGLGLPIELPPCEVGRLEEISALIVCCLPSQTRREKLAIAIETDGYIKKLLNVFHVCEDSKNNEGLHYLYWIVRNIFLLDKNALLELMFGEDTIFDVVGCLEYEPAWSKPRKHRQYLKSNAKFHQVLKIYNPELLSKIHQTYRVQYIQDVILPTPSLFDANMSPLSSFIFFNKVEIVSLIQEDERFLRDLFVQLTDENVSESTRKETVLFLKEFCTFSRTLQPQAQESFFQTLNHFGVLPALQITLASENSTTKSASMDILLFIVDFSPPMVHEYMLSNAEQGSLLMNVIIEQMTCNADPDMSGVAQLMSILRILLYPENMLPRVNKSEKKDFLTFFYDKCMHVLIAPLLANTPDNPDCMDLRVVQLLSLILELLSFCVEHHVYHIKNYIVSKDLLRRILVLVKSRHTFLVLCALRFMRKIISVKDEFYNRYITKGNLFAPVIDAFVTNNGRYNLLDSAILEMFEFIKVEDIKTLCKHVVENYGPTLDKINYVQTFKALKLQYDQQQDGSKDETRTQLERVGSVLQPDPFGCDPRDVDEDEEARFKNEKDVDNEDSKAMSTATTAETLNPGTFAATFVAQIHPEALAVNNIVKYQNSMLEDSEVFRDAAFEDKNEITSDGVMPEQGKVPLEHHVDNGERQSTMKKGLVDCNRNRDEVKEEDDGCAAKVVLKREQPSENQVLEVTQSKPADIMSIKTDWPMVEQVQEETSCESTAIGVTKTDSLLTESVVSTTTEVAEGGEGVTTLMPVSMTESQDGADEDSSMEPLAKTPRTE